MLLAKLSIKGATAVSAAVYLPLVAAYRHHPQPRVSASRCLRLVSCPYDEIKVVLSDSTVVGEGEDMIVTYIRSQRKRTGSQDATVNMHEKYTKPKYYTKNFDCELHDVDRIKRNAVLKYTQGVCWIMHSYY